MADIFEAIKKSIRNTGLFTELHVVQCFHKQKWQTVHSTTYVDLDENINREVDALAVKRHWSKVNRFSISFYLVVEVKHSTQPWVCFTTRPAYSLPPWIVEVASNTRDYLVGSPRNLDTLPTFTGCGQSHFMRSKREWVGRAFHTLGDPNRDPKGKEDKDLRILPGLQTSSKAARFFADQMQKRYDDALQNPGYHPQIDVFHSILVCDSRLFDVHLDEEAAEVITEEEWIPAEITYSSPAYRKGTWGDSFYPDIVTLSGLPAYLEQVELWRQAMIAEMEEVMTYFVADQKGV